MFISFDDMEHFQEIENFLSSLKFKIFKKHVIYCKTNFVPKVEGSNLKLNGLFLIVAVKQSFNPTVEEKSPADAEVF